MAARRLVLVAAASGAFLSSPDAATAQIAIRGETVHTMAGPAIRDGVVLVRNGRIERVGPAASVQVPGEYRVISARVVTPGLIDAHTVVGLSGYLNQPHDQMQLERSAAMQPELRAIDAYDAREELVTWLRQHGVTTIHTGHGPGALISGGTMIAKTAGETVDEAVIVPDAMIAVTLGPSALAEGGRSPGTRAKQIALLRQEFLRVRESIDKRPTSPAPAADKTAAIPDAATVPPRPNEQLGQRGTTDTTTPIGRPADPASGAAEAPPSAPREDTARDLRREALARVARREMPLLVTAHRAQDILSALRLAREFNIRIVLDGAAEAYLVIDEIKAAGTSVILHPTMYRAAEETENLSMETAARLRKAGIPFALQSGFEAYVPKTRVVLFEAAAAAAHGLAFDEALGAVTIDAARVLGISNRVGSLEAGKDADLALFDGDPFEYTSHVVGVVIAGNVVSEEKR
jgi:imidazolonepropionase-like amidohydrolase